MDFKICIFIYEFYQPIVNLCQPIVIFYVFLCDYLWRHHQYLGKVKQAVFHTQKAGRKRVIVSTEENAIASLDLRRGGICKFSHVPFEWMAMPQWLLDLMSIPCEHKFGFLWLACISISICLWLSGNVYMIFYLRTSYTFG